MINNGYLKVSDFHIMQNIKTLADFFFSIYDTRGKPGVTYPVRRIAGNDFFVMKTMDNLISS
jgi:hypothetical protein